MFTVIVKEVIKEGNKYRLIYSYTDGETEKEIEIYKWFLTKKNVDVSEFEKAKTLGIAVKGGGDIENLTPNFIDKIEVLS